MATSQRGRHGSRLHRRRPAQAEAGVTLLELLVGLAVVLLMAQVALQSTAEPMARQAVEGATRRLAQGVELGRSDARRLGQPCALQLTAEGWAAPSDPALPPCRRALEALGEPLTPRVHVVHNLPDQVRFSRLGLVIDGGTVVIAAEGTPLRRCLVMALPLGMVRLGRYEADPEQPPESSACRADPSL